MGLKNESRKFVISFKISLFKNMYFESISLFMSKTDIITNSETTLEVMYSECVFVLAIGLVYYTKWLLTTLW